MRILQIAGDKQFMANRSFLQVRFGDCAAFGQTKYAAALLHPTSLIVDLVER